MSPNRIILAEYFTTDDTTLLFGVRADWDEPEVVEIKADLDKLRSFTARYFGQQQIEEDEAPTSTRDKIMSLDDDEWQTRMTPFIEPILNWAAPDDYLYLVPHDILHYLPLHTVRVEGNYLIDRNPVLYTPSASVLKYCQAKRKPREQWRHQALVLSDVTGDLPNGRSEALTVAEILGSQALLGSKATKALVTKTLADETQRQAIDVLHFSCHGKFDPFQALNSGLDLADERLTAEDIFGLEMQADLVVLSACESGVNERRPGDELIGLTRALIYAGTPSVIVSLWEVNDISTELLMTHFYECRFQGDTKVEALQKAQLYVRQLSAADVLSYYDSLIARLEPEQDERLRLARGSRKRVYSLLLGAEYKLGYRPELDYHLFDHPFYWAPFVLVGDWK